MNKVDTKPLPGKRESLRIEKSMVKTNPPQNKIGVAIPKTPTLIWFDEATNEFTLEDFGKLLEFHSRKANQSYIDRLWKQFWSRITRLNNEV